MLIGLVTMSRSQMRVVSGSSRISCFETSFCLLMVKRGQFMLSRGIMMVERSWMISGHDYFLPINLCWKAMNR